METEENDMDIYENMVARNYQAQLEEISYKKNSIIHLPTGSGKTFIATNLITRFKKDLQGPWGAGGKRTFFLVNNVPLVLQQKSVIEKKCPVTVGAYSSENRVDHWDKSIWDAELSAHQVIVMTGQILSDMLTHSYIRIEDINLIIFDECHHAVEDHMMRSIMKHFENCPPSKHPRVLGLTATLLNGNVVIDKIEKTLKELETTFHATIATATEFSDVLNYSTNPREIIMQYKSFQLTPPAIKATAILNNVQEIVSKVDLPRVVNPLVKLSKFQQDISSDPKKIVKAVKNMVVSMANHIVSLGIYGGALTILAYMLTLERLKRKSTSKQESQLYEIVITHSTMARMVLLKAMEDDSGYDKILKHSSEQVRLLLNILKEYNPELMNKPGVIRKLNTSTQKLSGLIFTRERFTAKILYNLIKEAREANLAEFGFLKHDYITGFNVNPFNNTREDSVMKKYSACALLKFCNQDLNCLIATSVIEEGIDIPQCTLVVRFDPPLEYRSYIQSKGRARSKESVYILLVNVNENEKFMKKYKDFQNTETYIRSLLVGKNDDRLEPTKEKITRELYEDEDIPPYITPTGARLSAVSAISLISRYCSILPHDQFTVITPTWLQETKTFGTKQKRIVTVIMPIACPLKDPIQGSPMINTKSAKRSAALNACIKLHKAGELDPITLLPKTYGKVDFDTSDVRSCFLNWPWDEPEDEEVSRAGTKNRKRKYLKVFPKCLDGPSPNSKNHVYYLHVIEIDTSFPEPKEPREKALYELLKRDHGFGFLTSHPLPKICDFSMYLTVGEVKVTLKTNFAVIPLDNDLLDLIKQFHYLIFDEVLAVAKKYVVFDGSQNCMFVVPVKGSNIDFDIDWNTMQTYKEIPTFAVPTFEERKSLKVDVNDYKYAVVTPWYRTITLDRYIVSNVLEYMTPQSNFDSDSFNTYEDYFINKYNLTIVGNKDQPMLQVRKINSRMNCLLPRAVTIKAFSDKQQRMISAVQGDDNPKGFDELFIPEYCIKYDFPGVLWYKAMMLPSIVHRVYQLLVAHELRAEIATATKYGVVALPKDKSWQPIVADHHIVQNSLRAQVESPTPVNTIDRMHQPVDPNAPKPLNLTSMKESTYRLQQQKLNKEYPWDPNLEPVDIERNISSVTIVDLECYDEFVSAPLFENIEAKVLRSPPSKALKAVAILPPPLRYNDKIKILSLKPDGIGPELRDVLAAITTISSHDIFDLERNETLGDAFLKFAASLYLFHKFPLLNEGQLTNIKGKLIGNRNLFYAGNRVGLGGRMKVEQFSPTKDFLVPGFFAPKEIQKIIEERKIRPTFLLGTHFSPHEAITGVITPESWATLHTKLNNNDGSVEKEPENEAQNVMQGYVKAQVVSDKSIADCVEALVGTYLVSGGMVAAVKVLEWFQIIPPKDNLKEMLTRKVDTALTKKQATAAEIDFLLNYSTSEIEKILNYKFNDPSFILEALSHPSYIRNRLTRPYERLEFLGDAILDFLITSHIYENSRDFKPGDLTDLRSALVNNVTFASYVVKLGLHKYLCSLQNASLDRAIITFVEHQEQRDHQIIEDVLYLIDEEDCCMAEYVEVPKVLSDIFESLVAAIYLDSGGNLSAVWKVIYRIMHVEIDSFSKRIPIQPVRVLYENTHACPVFGPTKLTKSDIPKVMVPVTVTKEDKQITVYGFGSNKFQAKRAAAKLALKLLAL